MKEHLGYGKTEAEKRPSSAMIRYAIVAPTPSRGIVGDLLWFIHTWGVNLECQNTTDGQYVFESGEFSLERYNELLSRFIKLIEGAVTYIHSAVNKPVVLRITGIGFGVWSSAFPSENLRKEAKQYYLELLTELALNYNKWLQIRHPNFPERKTLLLGETSTVVENNHDPFGDDYGRKHTTVTKKYPDNSVTVIVNAWDEGSFIGNGGAQDNTLDGWSVSGGSPRFHDLLLTDIHKDRPDWESPAKLGKNAQNGSYLHNVFFTPSLLNTKNWIVV